MAYTKSLVHSVLYKNKKKLAKYSKKEIVKAEQAIIEAMKNGNGFGALGREVRLMATYKV